jgi:hypothetical protein
MATIVQARRHPSPNIHIIPHCGLVEEIKSGIVFITLAPAGLDPAAIVETDCRFRVLVQSCMK